MNTILSEWWIWIFIIALLVVIWAFDYLDDRFDKEYALNCISIWWTLNEKNLCTKP
jgi:hypothetical protein